MTLRDPQFPHLHWWEKTIEYAFVQQMLPQSAIALPMAAGPEAALGDLLLAQSTRFRLIEFKARGEHIQREKRKFPRLLHSRYAGLSFQRALLEGHDPLVGHDGSAAHWFVFGEQVGERVFLKAQKYCEEGAHLMMPGELLMPAVRRSVMVDYMLLLTQARERDEEVGESGGMIYCAVADGSIVPLPAEEFLRLCPEWNLRERPDDEPDSPAPSPSPRPRP